MPARVTTLCPIQKVIQYFHIADDLHILCNVCKSLSYFSGFDNLFVIEIVPNMHGYRTLV